MRSGLLRTRVSTLRLNRQAPWPSQIMARQRRWKRGLRAVSRHSEIHKTA